MSITSPVFSFFSLVPIELLIIFLKTRRHILKNKEKKETSFILFHQGKKNMMNFFLSLSKFLELKSSIVNCAFIFIRMRFIHQERREKKTFGILYKFKAFARKLADFFFYLQ